MVALEMANHILLVTQLDLPCLRNVVRLMMSFNEMEGIGEKVKIVVNRAGLDNGHITLKKAEETIGKEIFWQLPNDYRTMIEARNNGVPLIEQSPKAAITQSLIGLAKALSATEEAEAAPDAAEKADKNASAGCGSSGQARAESSRERGPAEAQNRAIRNAPPGVARLLHIGPRPEKCLETRGFGRYNRRGPSEPEKARCGTAHCRRAT